MTTRKEGRIMTPIQEFRHLLGRIDQAERMLDGRCRTSAQITAFRDRLDADRARLAEVVALLEADKSSS